MCGFLGELVLASGIVESPNDEEARESRVMQLDEKGDVAQKQVENQPRTSRHTHTHTRTHAHKHARTQKHASTITPTVHTTPRTRAVQGTKGKQRGRDGVVTVKRYCTMRQNTPGCHPIGPMRGDRETRLGASLPLAAVTVHPASNAVRIHAAADMHRTYLR